MLVAHLLTAACSTAAALPSAVKPIVHNVFDMLEGLVVSLGVVLLVGVAMVSGEGSDYDDQGRAREVYPRRRG
jgi:hypothetical protein